MDYRHAAGGGSPVAIRDLDGYYTSYYPTDTLSVYGGCAHGQIETSNYIPDLLLNI